MRGSRGILAISARFAGPCMMGDARDINDDEDMCPITGHGLAIRDTHALGPGVRLAGSGVRRMPGWVVTR